MWGLCMSCFFHFPLLLLFFFPLKEFRSQLFPVRLKLWHRLSAGGVNYPQPTLHLKTKWMLLWFGGDQLVLWAYCVQGSCWFGDWVHACLRVVRKNRGAWSLALMWQGNRLQCFTPVCGVNLSRVPSPFFPVLLVILLVINSPQLGGNAKFSTEIFLKWGKTECQGLLF